MSKKEQNTNEQEKKDKKKKKMDGERRFYLFTAIGCAAVLVAIIAVAIAVTGAGSVSEQANNPDQSTSAPSQTPDDEPTVVLPQGMALPMENVSVLSEHGFFHNTTLNNYYEHKGVDFAASAGTEVFAVDDGVVESIYKNDVLLGTEIVIAHEDGVKSVYRFVTETDDLKVGDRVRRGEVIATVAEPTGNEYKDGAHLHFEIMENGVSVDPTKYLTLEEK
ncbi:MAG: M23 family metallopeptidase [Clostridia bacterium]|nr:M23 family metallopeptidase [Clostridia bacterium]